MGHFAGTAGQADAAQGFLCLSAPLGPGQADRQLQGKGWVFPHGAPGQQQILLRHVAAVPLPAADGRAVHPNGAGLGLEQAVGQAEDGAFAAAADPEDAMKGARRDPKGEAVDDVEVLGRVLIGDGIKFQHGYGSRFQAMSQKPSSYRLHETKISSRR